MNIRARAILSCLSSSALLATLLLALPARSATGQDGTEQESAQTKAPALLRARHILIPWKGSAAQSTSQLSKEEAKQKAIDLRKKIDEGANFDSLARSDSQCPSKADGGYLGQFQPGRMVEAFTKAVQAAKDGEVVGPIETQFGWHIIERMPNPNPWPERFAVSHIVISFKGAERQLGTSDRTREAALELAKTISKELKAGKRDFAKSAAELSDDENTKSNGGSLGVREPGGLFPRMSDAIAALGVDQISDPVETPLGFHVLRREAVPEPLGAKHILIMHNKSSGSPAKLTKEEALAKANELLAKLKAGEDFATLAAAHSDCPSKQRGGDLGEFDRGRMVPAFEKAVVDNKVGAIVGPVETDFGYHIIVRTK